MKIFLFGFFILVFLGYSVFAVDWQTVNFNSSNKITKNPCRGLCFMPSLEPASKIPQWILDVSSIAYFRIDWADIIDENGNYIFEELDKKFFSTYREKGLRLAFRIMGANIHSSKRNVFPQILLKGKIPVVKHFSVYNKEQEEPVFWNENYIEEHGRMMSALGSYINNHPDVDFVDLGAMGEWGEMHLMNWSELELSQNNYSHEKYLETVFKMMEQMEHNLPETVKAFCVAPLDKKMEPIFAMIVDRAVRHNWWLRTDGFSFEGPPSFVKPYFDRYFQQTGFILEPSGGINRGYFGEPVPVTNYFKAVLASHPSVVNLMGMWDLDKLNNDDIKACHDTAAKVGYRFYVEQILLPEKLSLEKGNLIFFPVKITISQTGSAYYFGSALIHLKIVQDDKTVALQALFPEKQLSQLAPGEKLVQTFMLQLPADIPLKKTKIYIALKDNKYGYLNLANEATDAEKFLYTGTILLQKGTASYPVVFDMRKGVLPSSFKTQPDVKVEKGEDGWVIKGTEKSGWNFGSANGPQVKRDCIYNMKVQLRAWKTGTNEDALFFKFGIHKQNWEWIANINTTHYDFSKEGTWQELSVVYKPGSDDEKNIMFAIEKGKTAPSSINAEIRSWTVEEIQLP